MKWISVDERLPDYDEYVLWWHESGNVMVEALDKDGALADMLPHGTTHWMPLPPPPGDEQ